jgi:hypothetical protein
MRAKTFLSWVARFILPLCVLTMSLSQAQTGEQVWGYKVKPGDRLIDIAKAYQKSPDEWKKLQQKNAVPEPKLLAPGKQINIPVADLRQGNPVAEAVLVHGDVQRLNSSGQLVGKLSSGELLTSGDTVQTGVRSTLTIRFADDSRMLVTEKSKITLSSLVNYGKTGMADTKVKVHEGGTDSQVSPQKGPVARYEINTPAINLTVRGTGFRVQVHETSGATRTEVVEGLVAGNSDGSQAMIANGFGIVAEPGKPLGKPSQLLGAPVLNTAPLLVDRMPVRFEWRDLSGSEKYRLQLLARVQGNQAIIFDEVLQTTKVQWDDLPDGDYVMRVRGVDAVGLEGANAVSSFKLKARPEPPVLSFPQNERRSTSEKIFFRWESAAEADQYIFELAEDTDFKHAVALVPQISKETRAVLLALPSGKYFWRVASVSSAGDVGPYSDAFTFLQQSALTQGN